MTSNELEIYPADGRKERQPGETVELTALWALNRTPAVLEARLFWITRGKGTEDLSVVATQRVPAPAAAGEHVFRFPLPAAPWSFSGRLVSLLWAVEFIADQQSARWEFTLGPNGREVRLPDAPSR